jgi:hypothetical protein
VTAPERETLFRQWIEEYGRIIFKLVRAYAVEPHDQDDLFPAGRNSRSCARVWLGGRKKDRIKPDDEERSNPWSLSAPSRRA